MVIRQFVDNKCEVYAYSLAIGAGAGAAVRQAHAVIGQPGSNCVRLGLFLRLADERRKRRKRRQLTVGKELVELVKSIGHA